MGSYDVDNCFAAERHNQIRDQARAFAEAEIRPRISAMEASRSVDNDLSRLIARHGWIGITIGKEFGGLGLGHLAKTIVIEEISRVSGAMGAMVQASQLGVAKIIHFGNESQKRKWLPAIANGECLPTIAVTERQSGSHVLGMASNAERDGDGYILNGYKTPWIRPAMPWRCMPPVDCSPTGPSKDCCGMRTTSSRRRAPLTCSSSGWQNSPWAPRRHSGHSGLLRRLDRKRIATMDTRSPTSQLRPRQPPSDRPVSARPFPRLPCLLPSPAPCSMGRRAAGQSDR
nr:acyl-CoA dehydrogenase family protein [Mesorhizobium sp.]